MKRGQIIYPFFFLEPLLMSIVQMILIALFDHSYPRDLLCLRGMGRYSKVGDIPLGQLLQLQR